MSPQKDQFDSTDTVTIRHDGQRLLGTEPEIALVAEDGILKWEAKPLLQGQENLRLEIEFEGTGYGSRGPFAVKAGRQADNPARGIYLLTNEISKAITAVVDVPVDTYWKYRVILRDVRGKRIVDTLDPGVVIRKKK